MTIDTLRLTAEEAVDLLARKQVSAAELHGAYLDAVEERGELFVRDTGGSGPVVLLVHGWMFASDLNWLRVYAPLARAGYRVLAADLRGHGRGLRSSEDFTLQDCADDARPGPRQSSADKCRTNTS